MLNLNELGDYGKWIGQTALEVYTSAAKVGGWERVFPGGVLPRWASRIRQYFNVTPMVLKLLDEEESNYYLARAQIARPASRRAKARRKELQSRGMGISFHAPGSSTEPGTWLKKPDPNAVITGFGNNLATMMALSGDVYEDVTGSRSIWYQMSPGGAIYHFGEKITNPTARAAEATLAGQEEAPVFKLVCPDGTGGSREVCITNPFNVLRIKTPIMGRPYPKMVGHDTIGAVNEWVDVSKRLVKDSVAQGSYNYAETVEKGYPAHERIDVKTDPMEPGYYVEPHDLFQQQFIELSQRRFPPNDPLGRSLAAQNKRAP